MVMPAGEDIQGGSVLCTPGQGLQAVQRTPAPHHTSFPHLFAIVTLFQELQAHQLTAELIV